MLVEQWGAAQAHPRLHSALSDYMDELVDEVTDSPFLPAWVRPSSHYEIRKHYQSTSKAHAEVPQNLLVRLCAANGAQQTFHVGLHCSRG